jgi:ketosteroid isomerase-like protein
MPHVNEEFVREGYAKFATGDIEALKSQFFAPEIAWHFPGHNPFSGDVEGVDAVLAWLGRSVQATGGTFRLELHDVLANDEHAVALVTATAQRDGGRSLDDNSVQVFHIADGKVTEVWTYPADQDASDAFWSD